MNKMRYLLLTLAALIGLTVVSCIEDDFTTSPSDVLTFSRDTVSFDTVFTDVGTPTARLKVFNRSKKSVRISSIRFRNADTRFSLNVDGMAGKDFRDVEIRGRDSIYIFIECFLPEEGGDKPVLYEDNLDFVTNGVTQAVNVRAFGQNVTRLRALTLDSDMTLTPDRPYVVFDSLVVASGTTLRIEPGTRLLFHDKASLVIRGRILANGAPGKMIDLRGDRLDNVLTDVEYDIMAGQWEGVRIAPESFDNELSYVNMRSTVFGLTIDSCADLSRQKLTIVNSWLHNSQGRVLTSKYAAVDAYGVCFSEAADAVVALYGGIHRFVQCTIANYYLFSAITEPLLSLYHCRSEKTDLAPTLPLMNLSLENSIIYGLGGDLNEGNLDDSQVYLRNVLLKSKGDNDSHFISCLWDVDPLFYTVREDYIFNYRLRPESPAIGAGNPSFVTSICRYDMDGLDRLSAGNPDLGAYVYKAPPAEPAARRRR